jgi:ABC-2 type transport system ATP-binding protein
MLELDGVVRHFGDVRAVDGVSFTVAAGQVLGFIGPNGAGKTTTMRILATLDAPQEGEARIGGWSVLAEPEKARRITGFMPDYAGVYANTTVREYLDFFARANGLQGGERRQAVGNIIDFMGISDLADRGVDALSKGQQQRVALGRALVHQPDVLILDEPAANLDPRARIEFRTLIRELAADGKTILLSSHILTELAEMCDTIAVIEHGKILATGTVSDILGRIRAGRVLAIRVSGDHAGLERFLVERPGVQHVHEVAGAIHVEFTGEDAEQVALVAAVVTAGFPVLEFSTHAAGLEDLFIEITGGGTK